MAPRTERLWALRQADGQLISCKLVTEDIHTFNLMLFAGDVRVCTRRYLSRMSAELEAESLKERMIASVRGVLIGT
jgi:hypothetical protein